MPDNDRYETIYVQFIAQEEQVAQFIAHTCSSGLNPTIQTHPGDFRNCCHFEGAVTPDCGSGFLYFSIWLVKNRGNSPWQWSLVTPTGDGSRATCCSSNSPAGPGDSWGGSERSRGCPSWHRSQQEPLSSRSWLQHSTAFSESWQLPTSPK